MAQTTVHFATNREERQTGENLTGFTEKLNPRSPLWLRYGAADMTSATEVPFKIADLRVAPERIPGVTAPDDAAKLLGSESVFEGLRLRLLENDADLVLILHGYACTFENALSNAAELKTKWSTKSCKLESAVFSWPADGRTIPWLSYASDRDDARSSAKAVARALHRLLEYLKGLDRKDWCRANIHLVAHSMGNYMLRNALQAMLSDIGSKPLPRVLKTIFLMAADEDDDAFENPKKLARLPELAESVQVYFARNDAALAISDLSKGNPDRLGTTGPRVITALPQKVTLIDCTEVSSTDSITDANHQYYRKRAEVLADVRQVIAGKPPESVTNRVWISSRNCYRIRAAKS